MPLSAKRLALVFSMVITGLVALGYFEEKEISSHVCAPCQQCGECPQCADKTPDCPRCAPTRCPASTAVDSTSKTLQECQELQSALWETHALVDPGAAEQVPTVVSRVLRRIAGNGEDTFAQGAAIIDIGANKGRYSALLMDNTCNTIERR